MNGGWRVKTQILAAGKNWIIHEHIEYIEHEQCFKILTLVDIIRIHQLYNYSPFDSFHHGRQYKDQNWVKDIRRWPPQLVQKLDRFLRRETTWAEQMGADGNYGSFRSAAGGVAWSGWGEERQPVTTGDDRWRHGTTWSSEPSTMTFDSWHLVTRFYLGTVAIEQRLTQLMRSFLLLREQRKRHRQTGRQMACYGNYLWS